MKERPILFSGEMVKAILDGRKTMTRRVIKPQPVSCLSGIHEKISKDRFHVEEIKCSYGQPGDCLWVRETYWMFEDAPFYKKKRGYGWDVNPWVWVIEFNKVGVK